MRIVLSFAVACAATAHAQPVHEALPIPPEAHTADGPRGEAARSTPEPWGTVAFALGASMPVGEGFGSAWSAGAGLAARGSTPAYGGLVRASLGARPYTAADPSLPDFWTASAALGWGPGLALPAGGRVWVGAGVGAVLFRFEELDTGVYQNVTETEAAVGGWGRLEVPLGGPTFVWAEGEVLRVALATPATLVAASAGLGIQLRSPGWLRAFLR